MASRSQAQYGGSTNNTYALVGCYSGLVFVVVLIGDLLAGSGADLPSNLIIDGAICLLVGAVGMLLAFIEHLWTLGGHPPARRRFSSSPLSASVAPSSLPPDDLRDHHHRRGLLLCTRPQTAALLRSDWRCVRARMGPQCRWGTYLEQFRDCEQHLLE